MFIIYLNPSVSVGIDTVNLVSENPKTERPKGPTHAWKASVKVLTTTQALTKRSKVIPGGGPYPAAGPEATRGKISTS